MDFANLDESALGTLSKELYRAVSNAFPEFCLRAEMAPSCEKDGQSVFMHLSSPTNDAGRHMLVWVDEFPSPSLEFGPSHCHESAGEEGCKAIVDLIALILADKLVILTEMDKGAPRYVSWLNLSEPDALLEELTSPYLANHFIINSWTGVADREIRVSEI